MSGLLAARSLVVERGRRRLVENFDFALRGGEIAAVLGPNGAGKSSLLATFAGLLPCRSGGILLEGRSMTALPRRTIARRLGFLAQETEDPYPATVLETALIGRHPHIGFWRWESATDVAKAHAALRRVGLDGAADRTVATLSGGERRRLAIASLLAQAPRIYLLDEPLEALDLAYQARLLRLLRRLVRRTGAAVMLSLHDLSVAARHADRVILLDGHGAAEAGPPARVLQPERLSEIYGCEVRALTVADLPFFIAG